MQSRSIPLSDPLIHEVSKIVSEMSGVQLGEKQAPMVASRLISRMTRLGITKSEDYLRHLRSNIESESQALLSLLTTHHTYFFREFSHFEFILNKGMGRMIDRARTRGDKTIRVWSAACSTGQEVYSLAMFFNFHLKAVAPDIQVEILGTDVDPKSVDFAKNGVYKAEELKSTPAMYVEGHWIRGTGEAEGFYKANKKLRLGCQFSTLSLFSAEEFLQGKTFDLIFCRNVFIYFNEAQVRSVSQTLLSHLDEEGFLVLGISETLFGLDVKASLVGPSTYQLVPKVQNSPARAPLTFTAPEPTKPVRVLCIDDSPTIHALLKRILVPDQGFQIAAAAKNGQEALEILKTQSFDAITLDLHMPEVDGVTFLQRYTNRKAPILILSSVNREEASLGKKALSLGAFDYVEKPALENLAQAGNEIRAKLKLGLRHKSPVGSSSVSAQGTPATSSKKLRVLIVDDSATIRDLLGRILSTDPTFEVVGQADRPSKVENLLRDLKPDLMTLDIHMPEMDGVTLLKRLPSSLMVPTVMISSISSEEGPQVLEALENGAIDYIQKPTLSELMEMGPIICERLKTAASAKKKSKIHARKVQSLSGSVDKDHLIVIGASTGGTEALRCVLEAMPKEIPPILIVQHIPPVFSKAFAERLNQLCPFEVKEAADGDEVKPNRALIAPGGKQMKLIKKGDRLTVRINDDAPMNRHKPSVDYLFKSVAESGHKKMTAAILTGMGADGAKQMKVLRDRGARTIAQNEATCVVFGMPREAIEVGGAEFILPLDQIAQKITELAVNPTRRKAG